MRADGIDEYRSTLAHEKSDTDARSKFEALFAQLGDLDPQRFTDTTLAEAYREQMGEALRYLAGPPISDDDLKVIADVRSLAPNVMSRNHADVRKVFDVIECVIDEKRFPWVREERAPTPEEKSAALLASSVLLAAQRMATKRRNDGKLEQEGMALLHKSAKFVIPQTPAGITA